VFSFFKRLKVKF